MKHALLFASPAVVYFAVYIWVEVKNKSKAKVKRHGRVR